MTLFQYADAKFQVLTQELQVQYSVSKDAQTKACMWLIKTQHAFYRWISVPTLLCELFLVKVGLMKSPEIIPRAKKAPPIAEPSNAEVPSDQKVH